MRVELPGAEVAEEPVHALQRRLDVAVTVAERELQAFVGVCVPEGQLAVVLRGMQGAGREAEREGCEPLQEQPALRKVVISEESGHE